MACMPWLAAVTLALLGQWSLSIPSASGASFEQVGCFAGTGPEPCKPIAEGGEFSEEVQLGGVGGMAVNYTGAGGAQQGTVYAATKTSGGSTRVSVFAPEGAGMKFSLGWEAAVTEGPYERCGPLLGEDSGGKAEHPCPIRAKGASGLVDVDVSQVTGNVYVYLGATAEGANEIVEYSADGTEVIARFGGLAPEGQTVAESPEKIHRSPYPGGIAVNGAGEVYVFDKTELKALYHRLMVFKPKTPGNYKEYLYAGEVAAGSGPGNFPTGPIADAAGNIYVGSGTESSNIEMYAPGTPMGYPAPPSSPACSFAFAKSGITVATVNPETAEVYFFSYKNPKRIFQLAPCNEENGKFEDPETGKEITGEFEVKPERDDIWGMAFDPKRELPSRGLGVLYGAAPGSVPGSGVGKGEPGQSSLGYILGHPQEDPPVVSAESVANVKVATAQLRATIDPKGHATHYLFQYLTEAAYQEAGEAFTNAQEAPPKGATLEGTGPRSVGVTVSGLLPDTAYRYRVVAESKCVPTEPTKACPAEGAAESFHTFPPGAKALPDNRAYELVSPAMKRGGEVFAADPTIDSCGLILCKPGATYQQFPMQSAPGGNAIVYEGFSFAPGTGAALENQYIAHRDNKAGWQNTNLSPLLLQSGSGQGYKDFDDGLTQGILEQISPALSPVAPIGYENLYLQPTPDPLDLSPLIVAEPSQPAGAFKLTYAGSSSDLSRVFFAANDALTGEAPFAPPAADGGPGKLNLYEWEQATGQLSLVNVMPGNAATEPGASFGAGSAHSISDDGSNAFWASGSGQIFVREEAQATREIPNPGKAKFLAASADGSKVVLDDGTLYDLETEASVDLTSGSGGFQGVAGESDDLSHIYFVDTAVLTGEEVNSEGNKAQAGKFNLYAWIEGTTRLVATLLEQDNTGGSNELSADWSPLPSARTAQASPKGRFLAFISQAPLTGDDNVGPCESDHAGGFVDAPCPEAFLYDSATGELSCPSCSPSGAAPLGWAVLRRGVAGARPHYLTDSGRLYFDSQDSLSPLDTNEGIEDVYQFEPEGEGSCEREGGCVSLLSAGHESVDSNFLAMDETGKNVFFTSRDRLVAADKDDLVDLYDAREKGGFPPESEPPPPNPPLQIPPFEPTPASPGLVDPGNVDSAPRCKKGQVRRKGKCVRKRGGKAKHKRVGRGRGRAK
jgi:hypothetical protein